MHISRHRAFAIAAIVSLISVLGIQSPASADSAKDSRLLPLTSSTFFARGVFASPWKVGTATWSSQATSLSRAAPKCTCTP
jgi:hypothetical protein